PAVLLQVDLAILVGVPALELVAQAAGDLVAVEEAVAVAVALLEVPLRPLLEVPGLLLALTALVLHRRLRPAGRRGRHQQAGAAGQQQQDENPEAHEQALPHRLLSRARRVAQVVSEFGVPAPVRARSVSEGLVLSLAYASGSDTLRARTAALRWFAQ